MSYSKLKVYDNKDVDFHTFTEKKQNKIIKDLNSLHSKIKLKIKLDDNQIKKYNKYKFLLKSKKLIDTKSLYNNYSNIKYKNKKKIQEILKIKKNIARSKKQRERERREKEERERRERELREKEERERQEKEERERQEKERERREKERERQEKEREQREYTLNNPLSVKYRDIIQKFNDIKTRCINDNISLHKEYKNLSRAFHPDKIGTKHQLRENPGIKKKKKYTEQDIHEVTELYKILGNMFLENKEFVPE
jgi:hypothetical protein